jgi:hypothetical protein
LAGATHEALLGLAKEYEQRARTAMQILTGVATGAVMLLVMGVMVFAIFSIFFNAVYPPYRDALEMTRTGRI